MRWSLALIGLLVTTSCTLQKNASSVRFDAKAPQSEREVGLVIVSHDEPALAEMMARTGTTARRLNQKWGWYEVFGLSSSDLQKELPASASLFEANHYVRKVLEPQPRNSRLSKEMLATMCHADQISPQAVVKTRPKDLLKSESLVLGSQVKFSAAADPNEKNSFLPFQFFWSIKTSAPSVYDGAPVENNEILFKPDTPGGYEVVLIVRDRRGACNAKTFYFSVTSNPPREHFEKIRKISELELKSFTHLQEIHAIEAWKLSKGKSALIAIVDTGVNYNHEELGPHIYTNPKEIPGNGIDDDENGLVDDEFGWDFANNDNRPFDDTGHGSHVAGLTAATTFGVAPEATILPVKVFNAQGGGDVASIAAGIIYAVDSGAKILNMSFGSSDPRFRTLKAAIDYAEQKGVLVVAAAGNGEHGSDQGLNIDYNDVWPATFSNDNIISVAASFEGKLARYSNFGVSKVDLAAPGGDQAKGPLRSTSNGNTFGALYTERAGSSMSAGLVSGAAAILLDLRPTLTPAEIRTLLMETGTPTSSLKGFLKSDRILNVEAAVKRLGQSQTETKVAN